MTAPARSADEAWMSRALDLARRSRVSPRPPVGAVVVDREGRIVGEGRTAPSPGPHAEIAALRAAGDAARGSTLYVTLEPCSHHGETPPCVDAILAAGIVRVVAATPDPNPLVDGRGLDRLRDADVDVAVGIGGVEAAELIAPFTRWIVHGRPLVTLKLAASLDGKVAAADGTSRWISGPASRAEVHELRGRVDAVMVGSGTALADDPRLTCRVSAPDGPQPVRVLLDGRGRVPAEGHLADDEAPTVVLTTGAAPATHRDAWMSHGASVHLLPPAEAGVDLPAALALLGELGVCHVLCEGGPTLAGSFLAAGLVDRLRLYLAPLLIGGDSPGLIAAGAKTLAEAWGLGIEAVTRVGDDIRIDARTEVG